MSEDTQSVITGFKPDGKELAVGSENGIWLYDAMPQTNAEPCNQRGSA